MASPYDRKRGTVKTDFAASRTARTRDRVSQNDNERRPTTAYATNAYSRTTLLSKRDSHDEKEKRPKTADDNTRTSVSLPMSDREEKIINYREQMETMRRKIKELEEENRMLEMNFTKDGLQGKKVEVERKGQPRKSQEELETYKKMNKNLQKENSRLTSNITILRKEKTQLTEERTALQNRLSTIAFDRLTHENPNIADLSDADRPTKLQEVYREIYDNAWTDAFEELTTHTNISENDAIGILLKIIMNSFHNCRKVTWGRYDTLVNVASSIHLENETPLPCTEKNRSEQEVKSVNAYNDGKPNEKTEDNKSLTSADETKKTAETLMNTTSTNKRGAENNETSWDLKSIAEDNMKDDKANIDTGSNGKEEAAKEDEKKKETYDVQNEKMWSTNTSKDMATNKKLDDGTEQKDKEKENKETPKDPKQTKYSIELNVDILHALKRIWKMSSSELKGISVESICSLVVKTLDMPLESMPKTSKYLKSCVDLCWKMGVQEMPLHLESIDDIDVKADKKFDNEKFKHYTKSGDKVDFVVWPALYLYKGGPLLLKGIAQGC